MKTTYHLLKTSYQIVIKMKRQQTVWIQNASHISLQTGRNFSWFLAQNIKSLSSICHRNDSFPAFEGMVS